MYDSPTCGHSWYSMTQPCGYLQDLLNCPMRRVFQTLIAPPYVCPTCNRGFADAETIQMIHGPWGCNQMIRGYVGGTHSIPGHWGSARLSGPLLSGGYAPPAITSAAMHAASVVPYDHRIAGPYGHGPTFAHNSMIMNGPVVANTSTICDAPFISEAPMITDGYDAWNDGYSSSDYYYYEKRRPRRRRRHRTRSRYYESSSTHDILCAVM